MDPPPDQQPEHFGEILTLAKPQFPYWLNMGLMQVTGALMLRQVPDCSSPFRVTPEATAVFTLGACSGGCKLWPVTKAGPRPICVWPVN